MVDDRPPWARRMTNERNVRGWSQAEAVRAHSPGQLPGDASLLRQWKRWETGADHRRDLRHSYARDVPGSTAT